MGKKKKICQSTIGSYIHKQELQEECYKLQGILSNWFWSQTISYKDKALPKGKSDRQNKNVLYAWSKIGSDENTCIEYGVLVNNRF